MRKLILAPLFALLLLAQQAWGAIGCTLSNPAQDLKYLFPEMTSFKEEAREFGKLKDGAERFKELKTRLGGDLDPVYETYDTPYTVYRVYKGEEIIGVVHGVNVPGRGGVIQVFISSDPKTGAIKSFFFQRLESAAAKELKKKEFRAQFADLTLADFYKHDYYQAAEPNSGKDKVAKLLPPANLDDKGKPDYAATLRGIRKNLILLDLFVYERQAEPFYQRAQESLAKVKAAGAAKTAEPEKSAAPPEAGKE